MAMLDGVKGGGVLGVVGGYAEGAAGGATVDGLMCASSCGCRQGAVVVGGIGAAPRGGGWWGCYGVR